MISVNGEPVRTEGATTVAGLLAVLGIAPDARGIAVAVEGEVVPRRQWTTRELGDDARVEVLTAMQGG